MKPHEIPNATGWSLIRTFLPEDIDETAMKSKALVRRRNIPNAEALLRVFLAYAVTDMSFKDTAAWASSFGIAQLRGPSLHWRLKNATPWLEEVLRQVLKTSSPSAPSGMRFVAVDATFITGPAPEGIEWKVHVVSNPEKGHIESFKITDRHVSESFNLHPLHTGDVVLGDRAYATAKGMYFALQSGANVIVRCNPKTIRVCSPDRQIIRLMDYEGSIPQMGELDLEILIPVPPEPRSKTHKSWPMSKARGWIKARAIGSRTRKGQVLWILCTLERDALSATDILRAYRFRWQIELLFKRLKSLLNFDELPAKEKGPTAKAWILARLLAAALVHILVDHKYNFFPWGYELRKERVSFESLDPI